MRRQPENRDFSCPTYEIASYIDGELDGATELELESHFEMCETCSEELNQQKQFLCTLNSSLRDEREFELPADFARLIAMNAESTVSGLRRPRERFNAIFICAALILFVLFALGSEAGKVFEGVSGIFDQIAAVGGFFGHLVYSFFLGVTVILRSFAAQLRFDLVMAFAVAAFFTGSLMLISRKVLRYRRA